MAAEFEQNSLERSKDRSLSKERSISTTRDYPMNNHIDQSMDQEYVRNKKTKKSTMSILENNLLRQLEHPEDFEPITLNIPHITLNKREKNESQNRLNSKCSKKDLNEKKKTSKSPTNQKAEKSKSNNPKGNYNSQKRDASCKNVDHRENIHNENNKENFDKQNERKAFPVSYSPTFAIPKELQNNKLVVPENDHDTSINSSSKKHKHSFYDGDATFRPLLCKKSLAIAANFGDPRERLVSKRNDHKSMNDYELKECTFTPKINRKSRYLDDKIEEDICDNNQTRHEQLYNKMLEYKQHKKEIKEILDEEREEAYLECTFQPERFSKYQGFTMK